MKEFKEEMIDALEEEKEFEKIKVTEFEMIVELVDDKPYYSIRYFDMADMCWHIGYSSYDLKKIVEWKDECFEVVGTNGGWIPCSKRLPEDGREVLAYCDNGHCSGISVVRFRKGKTKEELQAMELPYFGSADQWGNNLKPYAWFENGPMEWFGQDVIAWQPLPKPYNPKGE